jgi:hypothetical protein
VANEGLRILFADLRRAAELSLDGKDHGRVGAAAALGALWRFVVLFEKPLAETLHLPILRLQDHLASLERGDVPAMLRPAKLPRGGRAESSGARHALRGHVAGTVRRLLDAGLKVPEAHKLVAKELKRLNVKPERGSGGVTADTVRHWCEAVAADVGRRGTAARIYDEMLTDAERARFLRLEPIERRRFAVASLATSVRKIAGNWPS